MGLYVAREIVIAHGGTIQASNRDGGGATIEIRLPIRLAITKEESCPQILVVDDDTEIRETMIEVSKMPASKPWALRMGWKRCSNFAIPKIGGASCCSIS